MENMTHYIPNHNYYTRYSVKHPKPNSCDVHLFDSTALTEQSRENSFAVERQLNKTGDVNIDSDTDASDLLPYYPSACISSKSALEIYKAKMRATEYPRPGCGGDYGCTRTGKWSRTFAFFVTLGLLVLVAFYMYEEYGNSCDSLSMVKNEIGKIKKQMDGMKSEVLNVMKLRDTTESKLNGIESLLKDIHSNQKESATSNACGTATDPVKEILDEYDADKTGKADFALESAGGSIVSTLDTENFYGSSNTLTLFGMPLCESNNNPRSIIQPGTSPGQCWAFKGSEGQVLIKLLSPVNINGVTLEHIAKSISPSGEISTAPKDFSIWAAATADGRADKLLGKFVYDVDGPSLQYFAITGTSCRYQYILFRVHSNHGNLEFTCVYRLRVHGNI